MSNYPRQPSDPLFDGAEEYERYCKESQGKEMNVLAECWQCHETYAFEDAYCPLCFAANENWLPEVAKLQRVFVDDLEAFLRVTKKYLGVE